MKHYRLVLLSLVCCVLSTHATVNDTFSSHGIRYLVTKENPAAQAFEVSAVHYDSAYILLPESISNGLYTYAVTDAIQWYNPQNCALRHYAKIDMSEAKHITLLFRQTSGLIAIDTLVLPPNLKLFPVDFYTSDSLDATTSLMDTATLLPGIHRIWSTGTQALENLSLSRCTSLVEADLSSYTTTFSNAASSNHNAFSQNPFLERLVIPNTITSFYGGIFEHDYRLKYVNIPDSLSQICGGMTSGMLMDTLKLGKKVSYILPGFEMGWYYLRHIDVDTANTHFMDDDGVLYTKNQSKLYCYPNLRDGSEYKMSKKTDTICGSAFAMAWDRTYFTDIAGYAEELKALADAMPLKKLECSTALKSLDDFFGFTFYGSSIRTISRFGENYVKVIPQMCFKLSAIDSITLPFGLTEIRKEAFRGTYNLQVIENLPGLKHLRTIEQGAFRDAWKLKELDLIHCGLVTDIPMCMCTNDTSLIYASLPRNVQSVGDSAYAGCTALRQIVCPAVTPVPVNSSVFEGVDKQKCVLKVPARSLNLYQSAPVWQEFFNIDTAGFYVLETLVSDISAGTVTGGGAYFEGQEATLTANANTGYRFVAWSDGFPYSQRMVDVTADESFTAIFEPVPFYYLTVSANDDTMGEVSGSGLYEEGYRVPVTATAFDGYYLKYWSFTDNTDASVIFTMPSADTSVTAFFAPLGESTGTTKDEPAPHKLLKEGKLYILKNNKTYTLQGQKAE